MATSEQLNSSRYSNIISVQIQEIASGYTQVIRTPKKVSLKDGSKTATTDGVDSLGRATLIDRYVIEQKGTFMVEYSGQNLAILALRLGRTVEDATATSITVPFRRQATKASFPVVPTGAVGDNIVADAVTTATARLPQTNTLQLLTQQSYAGFVAATPNSFAIGAGGAVKFSDDLVLGRCFIELQVPIALDYSQLSETNLGTFRIRVLMKSSDDTLSILEIYNAKINAEGVEFDPLNDTASVNFDILGEGVCQPWNIKQLVKRQACIAA